jgi:hypothetical protein
VRPHRKDSRGFFSLARHLVEHPQARVHLAGEAFICMGHPARGWRPGWKNVRAQHRAREVLRLALAIPYRHDDLFRWTSLRSTSKWICSCVEFSGF